MTYTTDTLPAAGAAIAVDRIAGADFQRTKIAFGAQDVATDVSTATPLPVKVGGVGFISAVNSSAANLAAAAVFTGASEDVSGYAHIVVSIFASHASATDGLQIQQSMNGTDWDFGDSFSIPAGVGKTFSAPVQAQFYRLVYTNGGTLTTALRITSLFSTEYKKASSLKPQDGRTNDNDFEEALAHLMGYNGATWDRLRATVANGLAVDITRQPALTKGTQGTTGVSTQDLKDAGRVHVNYYATGVAAGATGVETAISLTKSSGTGATSAAVSHVVASGKRFRVTSVTLATRGHATATAQITTFSLRINTAGAVATTTTPVVLAARSATPATALAWDRVQLAIPDGFEIVGDGTLQIGLTANAVFTTNAPTWDVLLTGFEY